tara:strand:+ start:232 stop:435 length:204 start_codon:yes stop_codon:yes gene_type:complete
VYTKKNIIKILLKKTFLNSVNRYVTRITIIGNKYEKDLGELKPDKKTVPRIMKIYVTAKINKRYDIK